MSDRSEPIATQNPEPTDHSRVTEDFLLARFREKPLASFLLAALETRRLISIAPGLHLSPLPGKRMKSMRPADHALLLARTSLEDDKPRKAVIEALNQVLPAPLFGDQEPVDEAEAKRWLAAGHRLDMETRLALTLSLLRTDAHKEQVLSALENGLLRQEEQADDVAPKKDEGAALRAKTSKAEQRAENAEKKARTEIAAIEQRELGLKQRIEVQHAEQTELQARAGEKNRELEEMHEHVERLKADLQIAFRRAARFKHALDDAKSLSERERELKEALTKERLRAEIEESKVEILEYQLDLMELEEHADDKPKVRFDDPTPDLVARYLLKNGRAPRVLIVGGAGKQRSHRERDFGEYKERLGIDGEWRFAEYGSWHRDLPRLRNDIRDRYDLVFVLHWNRTTFVQKMHDEARALNGRVRTVPYRGFLSLETAVSEELQRFCREDIGPT